MINYQELFYQSQAVLSDAIDALDTLSARLKTCMNNCEEQILAEPEQTEEPEQ